MSRIVVFALAGVFILTACGASSSSSDSNSNAPLETVPAEYIGKTNPYSGDKALEGAKIFQTNCEMCHGPQGHGDGPVGQSLEPKPKNLALLQRTAPDDYLFWRIAEGKSGTSMVGWKSILTEEQIWQIVSFIRTFKE